MATPPTLLTPIDQVSEALAALIRRDVLANSTDIDISLDAPDRDFVSKLSQRPVVNLYLASLRENIARRQSDPFEVYQRRPRQSEVELQSRPRFIELNYMLTTWVAARTNRALIEQQLMSRLVQGLAAQPLLPADLEQQFGLKSGSWGIQIELLVERERTQRQGDYWTALGAAPKPILETSVTIPVAEGGLGTVPMVVRGVGSVSHLPEKKP